MSSDHSITRLIQVVRLGLDGESEAQERLVGQFFTRLTALARKKLGGVRGYEDEHDVAVCAMKSFFHGVKRGEFTQLTDRDSLWALLAVITLNKATSTQRRQFAAKRDIRRNLSLQEKLREGPSDEFLDSVFQEGNRLLDALAANSLRTVAQMRMEGYSNEEIADRIGRSVKTVERKFRLIRQQLELELNNSAVGGLS
jgi:DNA-directed RNA polymerase specialized sigma24 family protein